MKHFRQRRLAGVALASIALASTLIGLPAMADEPSDGVNSAEPFTVLGKGRWNNPDDTPASPVIDKDGSFHVTQGGSMYDKNAKRKWAFFTGRNFDDLQKDQERNNAVNPADKTDRNDDTTTRCNNSPTGVKSTYSPSQKKYSQRNFCGLIGVWIDPDTGDWYGLVHNEFTPEPFGDTLHYDGIDYAVSRDQGRTWKIKDHVITSPYSTKRGDNQAFPQQTYHYGNGDQRLFVDYASGYFYSFYGSRIVDKGGTWKVYYAHVARSPISEKMAPGSWKKWYNGKWSEPGIGGKQSNMVPVDHDRETGYTDPKKEYNPANPGKSDEQVAAGLTPPTSPLFVMDITYNAHLGLYIGEPETRGRKPQTLYVTDNLATQKWRKFGDVGSEPTRSWYRWFVDSGNRTTSTFTGKQFRMYCSFKCSPKKDGGPDDWNKSEYTNVSINTSPQSVPIADGKKARISSGAGMTLAEANGKVTSISRDKVAEASDSSASVWQFIRGDDGSYSIRNTATGRLLGVDSTKDEGRAWGAEPATQEPQEALTVGQQWWVIRTTDARDGSPTGRYRLVNRFSGLVLALNSDGDRPVETTPVRSWDAPDPDRTEGSSTDEAQTLSLDAPQGGAQQRGQRSSLWREGPAR
jgi:hypothetical protein